MLKIDCREKTNLNPYKTNIYNQQNISVVKNKFVYLESDHFNDTFSYKNKINFSGNVKKTVELLEKEERILCVQLSQGLLFNIWRKNIPKDCKSIAKLNDPKTGFYGEAFRVDKKIKGTNVNKIYIAYKGTADLADLVSDAQILKGEVPEQLDNAIKFYKQVKRYCEDLKNEIINPKIICTGHSLGGALSQLVAAKYGLEAFSFNSPGMKKQLEKLAKMPADNPYKIEITPQKINSIKNYSIKHDIIGNYGEHVGEFYKLKPFCAYKDIIPFSLHLDFETLKNAKPLKDKEDSLTMRICKILAYSSIQNT